MQRLQERISLPKPQQEKADELAKDLQGLLHRLFRGSEAGRRAKDFLNGTWLSHPLHPSVTDVPIGAWTAALVLDGVEIVTGRDMNGATSKVIGVGVGGALASAASGAADWADTSGQTRRVGLLHAALNVAALAMYLGSLLSRGAGQRGAGRALSLAGFLTVLGGAFLGGELVFRLGNQVNRNAWGPKVIKKFKRAMAESDLPEGRPARAEVDGVALVMVRHGGRIHALHDNCAHMGCSLSDERSTVHDGMITCWCHGSTYRLEDGEVVHGPAAFAQPSYEVRVRSGEIEVRSAQQ